LLSPWQVKPPRIAEAAVQMECKLRSTYDVVNKCVQLHVVALPYCNCAAQLPVFAHAAFALSVDMCSAWLQLSKRYGVGSRVWHLLQGWQADGDHRHCRSGDGAPSGRGAHNADTSARWGVGISLSWLLTKLFSST
jgi:hypothetical protein